MFELSRAPRAGFTLIVVVSVILLCRDGNSLAHDLGVQLLKNSGFESGVVNSPPPDWAKDWAPVESGFQKNADAKRSGDYGLWIYTAQTTAIGWTKAYQKISAAPGDVFTGKTWIRVPPDSVWVDWVPGSIAMMTIEFRDSIDNALGRYDGPHVTSWDSTWQEYTVVTNPAPDGTVWVYYICYLHKPPSEDRQSVANFDDCYLELTSTAPPEPEVHVYPSAVGLARDQTQGLFTVANPGDGSLNWSVSEDEPWITQLSPSGGVVPAGGQTLVAITADRSGLSGDIYKGTISLTSDAGNETISVYMDTPSGYDVPENPSIVTTEGNRLLVRRRLPDGSLDAVKPYVIKGVGWSPAGIGDQGDADSRINAFQEWYVVDVQLIKEMNANTVYVFLDFGLGQNAVDVLDNLYKNDIMAIVTVDSDGHNDSTRITDIVSAYKDHPTVLMWAIGNEWNINYYHDKFGDCEYPTVAKLQASAQATETAAQQVKTLDTDHPVASIHGEIDIDGQQPLLPAAGYLSTKEIVNTVCPTVDVWGLNIYRGDSFGTLFTQWADIANNKPMFLSEFGTDSYFSTGWYDPVTGYASESDQRSWLDRLWADIEPEISAYDVEKVCIGGTVFEWCDEWWKIPGPDGDPSVHNNGGFYAEWNPASHPDGFANEEYFGITDIGRKTKQSYSAMQSRFSHTDNYSPVAVDDNYAVDEGGILAEAPNGVLINDVDTEDSSLAASLVLDASHGTLILNTDGSFTYTHDGSETTTDRFTYRANDGTDNSNIAEAVISVSPVNDAPTISAIANQSVDEDGTTGAIGFTVGDVETTAGELILTASSSDQTLVADDGIMLSGSGDSCTLVITPVGNASGVATITVTVSDGDRTASDSFDLTVGGVNDPPTIGDITDQSTDEDISTGAIGFSIQDQETDASELIVSASSSDQTVVADAGIALGGSGTDRTVTVTPVANAFGTATIAVTVSDGETTATESFDLTVLPVNDAPTISEIANQSVQEDGTTDAIGCAISDVETPAGELILTGSSSDQTLVADNGIVLGGSDGNRTLVITPVANASGVATITVTVSDGDKTASDSFDLTVGGVNDPPTISDITDQSTDEDISTEAIGFSIQDQETDASELIVSASSSDQTLVTNEGIALGGSGPDRTVTVTPVANAFGTATITVTVSDGTALAIDAFDLTVTGINDTPAISDISNQSVNEDETTEEIAFTVSDVETAVGELVVEASSSDQALVADSSIVLSGSGDSRTLVITPVGNASGTATITVTASDGTASASETFDLMVRAINDAPVAEDQMVFTYTDTAKVINLVASDAENDPLDYSIVTLPTHGDLAGTGSDISYTPSAGYIGLDSLTFKANDGVADSNTATVVLNITDSAKSDGFHIEANSGRLLDANGNEFVARGINTMLADYDKYNRNWYGNDNGLPEAKSPTGYFATDALPHIRAKGFNAVRLQWRMSGTTARLKAAIEGSIANEMVPIVALHDGTISDDTDVLHEMAAYWCDFWSQLDLDGKAFYGRHLIVNIANEWGSWDMDLDHDGDHDAIDRGVWGDHYRAAIDTIRSSGFQGTIIIDAPGGGQRPEAIREQGAGMLDHDPLKNVMFSLHVYENYQDHYDLGTELNQLQASKIPILIGEFGPRGTANVIDVMANTTEKGVGYIGWAWQGDGTYGECNPILNIVEMADDIPGSGGNETSECFVDFRDWRGDHLTDWGNTLVNDPEYGVLATAQKSSAFNESPSISDIADQSIDEDTSTGAIDFAIGDAETASTELTLSATSSDQTLVPNSSIVLGGSGTNRTVAIAPASNAFGAATIIITVSDGEKTASDAFALTVKAVDDPPTISDISNQSVDEDGTTGAIGFAVSDVETAAGELILTASSSDQALVADSSIVLGGSGGNRTIVITPVANASGVVTITVSVSDGEKTAIDSFDLTVNDVVLPSDVNDDGVVDLRDAILSLQLLAAVPTHTPSLDSDTDGDGRIGLPEAIHILEQLSEIPN